jgi:hypothetical protein
VIGTPRLSTTIGLGMFVILTITSIGAAIQEKPLQEPEAEKVTICKVEAKIDGQSITRAYIVTTQGHRIVFEDIVTGAKVYPTPFDLMIRLPFETPQGEKIDGPPFIPKQRERTLSNQRVSMKFSFVEIAYVCVNGGRPHPHVAFDESDKADLHGKYGCGPWKSKRRRK